VVGVLAGVLAVATIGAAPMLLATGTHLRNAANEPHPLEEIVDAAMQKYSQDIPMSSLPHEDCTHTRRCAHRGHQCYKKNNHWAGCRESCTPGLHALDPLEWRTPWSCEILPGDPDQGKRLMGNFPEMQIAVKFGNMKGLCLTLTGSGDGAPVKYMPCGPTATKWTIRTGDGDFDLWVQAGNSYGLSIRPSHCGNAFGSTAVVLGPFAAHQRNCAQFGLDWNNEWLELTKGGDGQGLCLTTASGEAGSEAIWKPCDGNSLQFEYVYYG